MPQAILSLQEITQALAYLRTAAESGKISTRQTIRYALDIGFSEGVHAERARAEKAKKKAEKEVEEKKEEERAKFEAELQKRNEEAREAARSGGWRVL